MKKIVIKVLNFIAFILGGDCKTRREAVDAGLCDYSGQGRNKYGK